MKYNRENSFNGKVGKMRCQVIRFGILEGGKLSVMSKAVKVEEFALMYLRHKVKKAGFSYNDTGRAAFMEDWKQFEEEIGEDVYTLNQVADMVSSNLIYSSIQFVDMSTRSSVSNEVNTVLAEVIKEKLISSIAL